MSQVDTQQTRPQSGKQNFHSVGQNGDQKSRPNRQGSGNRQSDENRPPKSRGGDRSGSSRGSRGPRGDKPLNKDSKTIYVGKVFTDDLDGSQIAEKLKEQRIKYLRDVLDQFGPIESFDPQVNDGYVLLTYDNHKSAEDALRTLKNREEVDTILLRVQDRINQSKLPQAVCPDLHKYRYSWSDKQAPARTAGRGKAAPQLPKTVVAKKVSDQQAPSPTTAQPAQQQQAQQQKPKKPRKGKEQEEQQEQAQPQPTQQPKPKKGQQQNIQQQAQVTALSPKTQGADDLQREAERARLTQDLHYLRQQQQHVSQELAAESDRCRARDERIQRLSEELNRVRQQEQFLESQLKAEQNWKQAAEERILKLTEEVTHFIQEQKQVEKRLTTVEQQLANGL